MTAASPKTRARLRFTWPILGRRRIPDVANRFRRFRRHPRTRAYKSGAWEPVPYSDNSRLWLSGPCIEVARGASLTDGRRKWEAVFVTASASDWFALPLVVGGEQARLPPSRRVVQDYDHQAERGRVGPLRGVDRHRNRPPRPDRDHERDPRRDRRRERVEHRPAPQDVPAPGLQRIPGRHVREPRIVHGEPDLVGPHGEEQGATVRRRDREAGVH